MSFDEDPNDVENYPCPECGKPVYKSEFLNFSWACSECSWVASSVTPEIRALKYATAPEARVKSLEEALGWKEIDRKDYTQNYEKMKHSRFFMEELVEMLKDENSALRRVVDAARAISAFREEPYPGLYTSVLTSEAKTLWDALQELDGDKK